ncbi:MAG: hypothetical protein ABIZ80_01265 [Bryobacteraceae bacterium]
MSATVVILGCGFTGKRVADQMLRSGYRVIATTRHPSPATVYMDVLDLDSVRALASQVPQGALVLHSIPVPAGHVLQELGRKPARVVYLSTTGVYGAAHQVDERTPIAPRTEREFLRAAEEQGVAAGPWSSLILRPAAIYGPGRGVHEAMRLGTFRLVDGGANYISRIHVDDLAAHAVAGMLSDVTGAYPVADEEPCTSFEIASYCARTLRLSLPPAIARHEAGETRQSDRRVDGSRIRAVLGVSLRYPSYRVGIPASLAPNPL